MSLVEKAIEKMRANDLLRKEAPRQPTPVIARVVNAPGSTHAARVGKPDLPPYNPDRHVTVDRDALKASGLVPPEDQERELMDQYRAIKRPLIREAFHTQSEAGISPQLVMIASALPGDGKTFTCINLALSMAREKDHSVLLVDADVIKPQVSSLFGVKKEPGLLDVLANPDMDLRSVILPTDIPGLTFLPAGTPMENATELLASARMREVAADLAAMDPSRIVLFDTLPILLTSEARVLTTLAGQIVLVVKAGVTPQHAVSEALSAIGEDKSVSLVLNQAELKGAIGYYYYGYRYGYPRQDDATAAGPAVRDEPETNGV